MCTSPENPGNKIKSPQLYQLSYRPKITDSFGKTGATAEPVRSTVSPVYPNGASRATAPILPRSPLARQWLESFARTVARLPHAPVGFFVPEPPDSNEDLLEPLRRKVGP